MKDNFKIYTDRLRHGGEEKILEKFSPDFLGINEKDLCFNKEIDLQAKAYLTHSNLIINFNINTTALIPCSICNQMIEVSIEIKNIYHTEELDEIKSGVFDFCDVLRETIILQVPTFIECNDGSCIERKNLESYLKSNQKKQTCSLPFSTLNNKKNKEKK